MRTVGSSTSAPVAYYVEQPVSSTLSKFTTAAFLVTEIAVIAMEANRMLNIIPFANQFLPAPTTNLAISATALAIFVSTFMLKSGNKPVQPKTQAIAEAPKPLIAEDPKPAFIQKSMGEMISLGMETKAYIAYFKTVLNSELELVFLKEFEKEIDAQMFDRRTRKEFSISGESAELFEALSKKYVVLSTNNLGEYIQRLDNIHKAGNTVAITDRNALRHKLVELNNHKDFGSSGLFVLTKAEHSFFE